MGVYVIVSQTYKNSDLENIIKEFYPNDHLAIYDNQWLVYAGESTRVLAEKLKINEDRDKGGTGPAIVFLIGNYWGRAQNNVWEWLKEKMEKDSG